jgi:hypothetical protein
MPKSRNPKLRVMVARSEEDKSWFRSFPALLHNPKNVYKTTDNRKLKILPTELKSKGQLM